MTSTMGQDQIVKVDRIGRVKTLRERREVLLAEFDRSGMSSEDGSAKKTAFRALGG
jgi:hypothetical protein